MKNLILVLIATFAATGAAQAQSAGKASGAYGGLAVSSVDKLIHSGRDTQLKVFGGYEFDQKLGVEAGVTGLGRQSLDVQFNGQPATVQSKGWNSYVAGKYSLPINQQLSAYGKLGLSYTVLKHSDTRGFSRTDSDTGLYAGLGFQYKVTDKVALTAEYERAGKRGGSLDHNDAWSLGVKYGF